MAVVMSDVWWQPATMNEAWVFDTLLPLLLFIVIFVIPLGIFVRQRIQDQRERRRG